MWNSRRRRRATADHTDKSHVSEASLRASVPPERRSCGKSDGIPTAWTAFDKRPVPAKISMKTNSWPSSVWCESLGHERGAVQVTGPPVLLPAASLQ